MLEGVVRQADSANQIGALGQIFADGRVFLVHGSLAGNKSNNPSGPHLVQRLPKEIVVDEPVVLVVPLIYHLEIPKGDVAHRYIKEAVGHLPLFKAVHGNAGILVKLLGDSAADTVQLHTVGFCCLPYLPGEAPKSCRCRRMALRYCPAGSPSGREPCRFPG